MDKSKFFFTVILAMLLFAFPLKTKAQWIDSTVLVPRVWNIHLLDLIRADAPMLKLSYEHQLEEDQYLGLEVGFITDFNASIYRFYEREEGIIGGHFSIFHTKNTPLSIMDVAEFGYRLNYAYKRRHIEDWVLIADNAYQSLMHYDQINHNIGLYLRLIFTRRYKNGFSHSIGINPGVLMQNVHTTLPEDASIYANDLGAVSLEQMFRIQKDAGTYLSPHIYFELNLGYAFSQ